MNCPIINTERSRSVVFPTYLVSCHRDRKLTCLSVHTEFPPGALPVHDAHLVWFTHTHTHTKVRLVTHFKTYKILKNGQRNSFSLATVQQCTCLSVSTQHRPTAGFSTVSSSGQKKPLDKLL